MRPSEKLAPEFAALIGMADGFAAYARSHFALPVSRSSAVIRAFAGSHTSSAPAWMNSEGYMPGFTAESAPAERQSRFPSSADQHSIPSFDGRKMRPASTAGTAADGKFAEPPYSFCVGTIGRGPPRDQSSLPPAFARQYSFPDASITSTRAASSGRILEMDACESVSNAQRVFKFPCGPDCAAARGAGRGGAVRSSRA